MDFEGRLRDEVSLEQIPLLKDLMLVAEEVKQGTLPVLFRVDVVDIESSAVIHFFYISVASFPDSDNSRYSKEFSQ